MTFVYFRVSCVRQATHNVIHCRLSQQQLKSFYRKDPIMDKEDLNITKLEDLLTESELIDFLGVKKGTVDEFRHKHKLPFCKITKTARLYIVKDVLDFISSRRTILNIGVTDQTKQGA